MSDRPTPPRRRRGAGLALATILALGVSAPLAAADPGDAATPDSAFDVTPAEAALDRLIGAELADQIDLVGIDPEAADDTYRIEAVDGRIQISGTTPGVLVAGFGHYLRVVAHADISINGVQLDLPDTLPLPAEPLSRTSDVTHRFALNDTNEGYAGAYHGWEEWQRRIDVLALNGINEVLVYEGQDAVYQQTLMEFGYTAEETRRWIPQPGHQPWWLLQNMSNDETPISQQLIDRRVELGQQMVQRLNELAITPVMPGYFGTVPTDFEAKNPGANTIEQGIWSSNQVRPDWLDPTSDLFDEVADTFYAKQSALFGDSTMYKMDLLHEGGRPGDVDVAAATQAVQAALERNHPGSIWAILGWWGNPRKDVLQAADRDRMLVVDGTSEAADAIDREADFVQTPYAFGTIWNFGGKTNMGVQVAAWNEKYHQWRAKPGTKLDGIALMPEAIDNNPAAVAFFSDLAWQQAPVDLDQWFAEYATARYGAADARAVSAWQRIAGSVYSWPADVDTKWTTGVWGAQPSLGAGGGTRPYDTEEVVRALDDLLAVDPALRDSDAYRYDLIEIGRQVLDDESGARLADLRSAYQAGDLAAFRARKAEWMDRIDLLDRLTGGHRSQMFGSWQQGAREQAATRAEQTALEFDIRTLVSIWDDDSPIQDYAMREWNGLVGDYYAGRWEQYLTSLETSLETGEPAAAINWREVAVAWAKETTRFRDRPYGDTHALAREIVTAPQGELELTLDRPSAAAGEKVVVTATFTNENVLTAARQPSVELDAPEGYQVRTLAQPARSVAAGEQTTARWEVTVPAGARPTTTAELTATVAWASGKRIEGYDSARATVLVAGPVSAPLQTRSVGGAEFGFAQDGDRLAVAGGGIDAYASKDQYGTIYRADALADGRSVVTTVEQQSPTGPWARAGLVVRADLADERSTGYATLALTPDHGCVLTSDQNGDGRLEAVREVGGFETPTTLRLTRAGAVLTAECSGDGENWVLVGMAQLPGVTTALDAGVFYSAANELTGLTGSATFTGFDVVAAEPRGTEEGELLSRGRPTTAQSSEGSAGPDRAVDGDRTNNRYWASAMSGGSTWWQVDLGEERELRSINVRTYVDGTRSYRYDLLGSLDGESWFSLGGKSTNAVATDAGDTVRLDAQARYVRVVGTYNSANTSFHLTEVEVRGLTG